MKFGSEPIKVHLGCGAITPSGWVNVDGSWNAWFAKRPILRKILKGLRIIPKEIAELSWDKSIVIHDVRNHLPFLDNSVKAIYASHLLEHLYLSEAKSLLRECYRILLEGGILRIVVPDLKSLVLQYNSPESDSIGDAKADTFQKKMLLRPEKPLNSNFIYQLYHLFYDMHSHKWLYDAGSLTFHFKNAGFVDVHVCSFLESLIEDIHFIEQRDRVLNGGLCIEGLKK